MTMWTCDACTFQNRKDDLDHCEICLTRRRGRDSGDGPKGQASGAAANSSGEGNSTSNEDGIIDLTTPDEKRPSTNRDRTTKKSHQMTLFGSKLEAPPPATTSQTARGPPTKNNKNNDKDKKENPSRKRKAPNSVASANHDDRNSTSNTKHSPTCFYSKTVRCPAVPYEKLKEDAYHVLKTTFRLKALRNLQPAAVQCALQQKSQIVVMATGGGKSLCYQLPAVVLGGVTIVVSPLLALMSDQVQALNSKGIAAAMISSTVQTETQRRAVLDRLLGRPTKEDKKNDERKKKESKQKQTKLTMGNAAGEQQSPLSLLYVTPESVKTEQIRRVLSELYRQKRIAMFAIDEAHCVSR